MPVLSADERTGFLQEPGVLMRIGVVRDDGRPLVTPIWFLCEQECIYFTPREKSAWFACLRRDPRVALCIDEDRLPYRKVVVEGVAELQYDIGEDDAWRDLYRKTAARYVGAAAGDDYVNNTIEQPRALYRVSLEDARVRTWRMPVAGEREQGIWHQRYYRPGTWGDAT